MLHALFAAIDGICDKHRVEKIETIGDAYLAATGGGLSRTSIRPMFESPPPPPRVCISINPEGKSCGRLRSRFRVLVLNDPPDRLHRLGGRLCHQSPVGPARYCLPRHQKAFQPSFLEINCIS